MLGYLSCMPVLESLHRPDLYPRSSRYDAQWTVDHCMGPNPLWLLEDLSHDCDFRPGMNILDLGCGTGLTSVFLAREFEAKVNAVEAWMPRESVAAQIENAGVADQVDVVSADARTLPFEHGQFDAIVAVDSYHYFGTDDLYIGYITQFLAPGGQLAIAVPALHQELRDLGGVPEHLRTRVGWQALSFHTAEWWRFQWDQSELVTVTSARTQPQGWADWKLWCEICAEHSPDETVRRESANDLHLVERDGGELLTFALITARKPT